MFCCRKKKKPSNKKKKKNKTTIAYGTENANQSEMQILETKPDNEIKQDANSKNQNEDPKGKYLENFRNSKSISHNLKSEHLSTATSISSHSNSKKSRKKMQKISAKDIQTKLKDIAMKVQYVNFKHRSFKVSVKQKSFNWLAYHFRDFYKKIVESTNFKIPVISLFLGRFRFSNYQNGFWVDQLKKCKHEGMCEHLIYDVISVLKDATPEELKWEKEVKNEDYEEGIIDLDNGLSDNEEEDNHVENNLENKKENEKNIKQDEKDEEIKESKINKIE